MARIDKFILNSDFPMPAQVGVTSVDVTMSTGTASGGEATGTLSVSDASIFRASIRSSRLGKTFVGANSAVYKAGSDLYVCAIGVATNGTAVVRLVNFGSSATTSSETVTVTVSSFRMP